MSGTYSVPLIGGLVAGQAELLLQEPVKFFDMIRRDQSLSQLSIFGRTTLLLNHPNYLKVFTERDDAKGKVQMRPMRSQWDFGGERLFMTGQFEASEANGVQDVLRKFMAMGVMADASFVEWVDVVLRLLPGVQSVWVARGMLDRAWEGIDALHAENLGIGTLPGWVPWPNRMIARASLSALPKEALPVLRCGAALRVGAGLAWMASLHEDLTEVAAAWRGNVMDKLNVASPMDRLFLEICRQFPPVWWCARIVTRRLALAGKDWGVGTLLVSSMIQTGRDSRFFSQPLTFNPDRWKVDQGGHLNEALMFPFGYGGWERPSVVVARAMFRTSVLWMARNHREVSGQKDVQMGAWMMPDAQSVLDVSRDQ